MISVVIPTYNEAGNILPLLEQLLALDLDLRVVVVDDDSPDGTSELARSLQSDRVFVLTRHGVRGYGSAALHGFRYALELPSDFVVSMDADFSHQPSLVPQLIERIQTTGADVVIGSRYCPDGGTINWPFYRMLLSRTANQYVHFFLGIPARDCTSGFRVYRRSVLESLAFDQIRSDGYSFLVEILYRSFLQHAKISEIPIVFVDRLKGKSKISSREIYRSIFMVLWLRWRSLTKRLV